MMQQDNTRPIWAIICMVLAVLAFSACEVADDGSDDGDSTPEYFTVTAGSSMVYYSLTSGSEVSGGANSDWDIAFTGSSQGIFLNGGATASDEGSSGNAAVWYTGSTDYDSISSAASANFSGNFAQDVEVYIYTDYSDDSTDNGTSSTQVLNEITALNYASGSGTSADPYVFDYYINSSNSTAYSGSNAYYTYAIGGLSVTDRVYIVRLADGSGYAKVQVYSMSGSSSERVRVVKFEVL